MLPRSAESLNDNFTTDYEIEEFSVTRDDGYTAQCWLVYVAGACDAMAMWATDPRDKPNKNSVVIRDQWFLANSLSIPKSLSVVAFLLSYYQSGVHRGTLQTPKQSVLAG